MKPNILIIQPDQHAADALGSQNSYLETRNLDNICTNGIQFTHCASNNPLCSPFRGTMQTGLYSHTTGIIFNLRRLEPTFETMAKILNREGYHTGYAGKWHLGRNRRSACLTDRSVPKDFRGGWDYWRGYERCDNHYTTYSFVDGNIVGYGERKWEPEWLTEIFSDFLDRTKEPWAFYMSPSPPHLPLQCPREFLDKYEADAIYPPVAGMIPTEFLPKYQNMMKRYYAQITALDHQVGVIQELLREANCHTNTIIMYTSDHGDLLGHHCGQKFQNVLPGTAGRRLRGKGGPYRSAFHVPLLMQWPAGIRSGQVCPTLVGSVDLLPTILELAGIQIPKQMQGHSMAGWCTKGKGYSQDAIYLEMGNKWRAIWDGRFVYETYGPSHTMFDHHKDSHELNNLYTDAAYKHERIRLASRTLELAVRTADPLEPNLRQFLAPNL